MKYLFIPLFTATLLAETGSSLHKLKPFFDKHCISCHGPKKEKGDLRIDHLSAKLDDVESVEHLQNILDEITVDSMPPEEKPRPGDQELIKAIGLLRTHIKEAADFNSAGEGKPVRRLTKNEFLNTVFDTMGVKLSGADLQDDGGVGSFETDATTLFVTDIYFENYKASAKQAVRTFIEDRTSSENAQASSFFKPFLSSSKTDAGKAKEILSAFAKKVSRGRTPSSQFLDDVYQIYSNEVQRGADMWSALVEPMTLSMCTLESMYHFENKSSNKKNTYISPAEYANRLSYFFWRSAPDAELLELAASGKIYYKDIRKQQMKRMIKDSKFDRFISAFTDQWLELERQDLIAVDKRLFPGVTNASKAAMKRETVEFIRHILRENLSLINLIHSDFMFVNEDLAKHYGISGVEGPDFQKVPVPKGSKRGGLLAQAGILMQTGTGERTSIVERGAFVARKMLNAEPPPPPPLVNDLPEDGEDFRTKTGAELVKIHASSPQCASCHNKIDPLGTGLEEFDAVGLLRDKDERIDPRLASRPARQRRNKKLTFEVDLDIKGKVFNGEPFEGVNGLKTALYQNKDRLAEAYIEAIISFANGRKAGISEKNLVDEMIAKHRDNHYLAQDLLVSIIESPIFQNE